jgi:hypothetical protein
VGGWGLGGIGGDRGAPPQLTPKHDMTFQRAKLRLAARTATRLIRAGLALGGPRPHLVRTACSARLTPHMHACVCTCMCVFPT